jgi:hypothetical protein
MRTCASVQKKFIDKGRWHDFHLLVALFVSPEGFVMARQEDLDFADAWIDRQMPRFDDFIVKKITINIK